jgi:hypothetical protein
LPGVATGRGIFAAIVYYAEIALSVVFLKRRIVLWRLGRQAKIFGVTGAAELFRNLGRGVGSK